MTPEERVEILQVLDAECQQLRGAATFLACEMKDEMKDPKMAKLVTRATDNLAALRYRIAKADARLSQPAADHCYRNAHRVKCWKCGLSTRSDLGHCIYCDAAIMEIDASTGETCEPKAESAEPSDTEMLDWCESNIDDVTVIRDRSKTTTYEITYCADESGCQIESKQSTFREAIRAAMRKEHP